MKTQLRTVTRRPLPPPGWRAVITSEFAQLPEIYEPSVALIALQQFASGPALQTAETWATTGEPFSWKCETERVDTIEAFAPKQLDVGHVVEALREARELFADLLETRVVGVRVALGASSLCP